MLRQNNTFSVRTASFPHHSELSPNFSRPAPDFLRRPSMCSMRFSLSSQWLSRVLYKIAATAMTPEKMGLKRAMALSPKSM